MKIVNLTQFLALPANTLFSKYAPCWFEDLMIKGDSLTETRDFLHQSIVDAIASRGSDEWADKLDDSEENGTSMAMDFNCQGRDGCFEDGQLFAVWELQDLQQLIERLVQCLPAAKDGPNV